MSDPTERVADELRKHRPSPLRSYPPKCRCGVEYEDFHIHVAQAAIDALQLTEEHREVWGYDDQRLPRPFPQSRLVGPWVEGER